MCVSYIASRIYIYMFLVGNNMLIYLLNLLAKERTCNWKFNIVSRCFVAWCWCRFMQNRINISRCVHIWICSRTTSLHVLLATGDEFFFSLSHIFWLFTTVRISCVKEVRRWIPFGDVPNRLQWIIYFTVTFTASWDKWTTFCIQTLLHTPFDGVDGKWTSRYWHCLWSLTSSTVQCAV